MSPKFFKELELENNDEFKDFLFNFSDNNYLEITAPYLPKA